ncbi:phosphotransferase [Natronobeatus ordinarius]|uniref:phosphotransferase n=1 Tax=Natronobeatus ordinarius TaxID=2963433 RepID=UPI0020CEAAE7|nr:phosphotransferase [Natronobeatus ordinarius]
MRPGEPVADEPRTTDSAEPAADEVPFRSFVDRFERGDRLEAVQFLVEAVDEPRGPLTDLFGVCYDGWLAALEPVIGGSCLDVSPGPGRHLALVSELADEVYALESDDASRRLLSARTDRSNVVPVAGDPSNPPFTAGSFETILSTRPSTPGEVRARAGRQYELLDEGGTLVSVVDGWPRTAGLTARVGLDRQRSAAAASPAPTAVLRSTPARYVSTLESAGFDEVNLLAVLTIGGRFEGAAWVDDAAALAWLTRPLETGPVPARLVRGGGSLASRLGILERSFPVYVAVCQKSSRADTPVESARGRVGLTHSSSSSVVRRGSNRAIVLEVEDGAVTGVQKLPNDPRNAHFNERTVSVLEALRRADDPVTETLPDVTAFDSRLGPTLVEPPIRGTPIAETVDRRTLRSDPEAFGRVLETGLEWVRAFQTAYAGAPRTRSPVDARRELTVEQLAFSPPEPPGPLRLATVPHHGDYHPGNLVVEGGSVERVIDWEYAALEGNPVADPGFYALKLAEYAFGDFERGVEAAFLEPSEHAAIVSDRLADHCERVEIPPSTFSYYLGAALVGQVRIYFEHDSPWQYHNTPREKVAKLEFLYDRLDGIRARLRRSMDETGPADAAGEGRRVSVGR